MTLLQSSIVPGGAGGGYQISRSLRFNSPDSAYLNRTPASAGNRKTWTVSGWFKKTALSTGTYFSVRNTASGDMFFAMRFEGSDTLNIFEYNGSSYNWQLQTTQVFRDSTAWMHIVLAVDTTQATASNRAILYINGVQVTAFSASSYPSLNYDCYVNNAFATIFGASSRSSVQEYFSGYMTETNFIDGQALTPSSFGETSTTTGVWNPKAYTGTYGTNGYYLNFSDNSNTTAATLGKDYSGNSNNFTPNNFSVTAGAGNDSLVDTPTNYGTDTGIGGEVRGDYATWNGIAASGATFANGNLDVTAANNGLITPTTFFPTAGKWYCEVVLNSGANPRIGITNNNGLDTNLGSGPNSWAYLYDGRLYYNASVTGNTGVGAGNGDVVMMALDIDAGKLWFGVNGTWMSSGVPSTGTNPQFTFTANQALSFAVSSGGGTPAWTGNFGQRAFAYTAPSGFKAVVTQNLATPTVGASSATLANKYFDIALYTGDGNATKTISGLNFQTDFLWTKSRSNAYSHLLYDVLRTFGIQKGITSNATTTEGAFNDDATSGYVNSVNSTGFQVTKGTAGEYTNQNAVTYCVWNWKAGGTGVSNANGSITSTVSANTTSGFSVVTYTGTAGNATVGHGLGAVPKMIIMKSRNQATNWPVYHSDVGNTKYLLLNTTNGSTTDSTYWNNTTPTSSVFSIGTSTNNGSSYNWVAYCFAEVAGFSKIGSYQGNGSTDGTFVYCGFRPKFLMVKNTDTGLETWGIIDSSRDPYNVAFRRLYPNLSNAENTGDSTVVDLLSNGFKFRSADAMSNASRAYIFMAFAESPFNYSRAR